MLGLCHSPESGGEVFAGGGIGQALDHAYDDGGLRVLFMHGQIHDSLVWHAARVLPAHIIHTTHLHFRMLGCMTSSKTFGRRLRAPGVPLETRKVLLRNKNDDITMHYSEPEIEELIDSANRICDTDSRKTHALVMLKRKIA
jgi:hypothetical protein